MPNRTTNTLLFIIAACLLALTAQQFGVPLLAPAKAAPETAPKMAYGCFTVTVECRPVPIRVDQIGNVMVLQVTPSHY